MLKKAISKPFSTAFSKHQETLHNFFWRALQVFGKQGISFLILVISAKLLSPYNFGIYTYVMSLAFFLSTLGDFGISISTSKYVAEYNIIDKNKLKLVLFNSGILLITCGIIMIFLMIVLGEKFLGDNYPYFLTISPLLLLAPLTALYDGVYCGLKKFKKLSITISSVGIVSIFIVIGSINMYGLEGSLVAQDLSYLLMFLALAVGYDNYHFKFDKSVCKEIGSYAFFHGLATLGFLLFARVDVIIMGKYNYIEEVGIYNLLNKVSLMSLFPFIIYGQIVAPNFTSIYTKKKYSDLMNKLKKYTIFFLASSVFYCIVCYFLFPFVFDSLFNEYFNDKFYSMYFLVILIYGVNVYGTVVNNGIIVPTGYARIVAVLNIFVGLFNVILSIFLIERIGYLGVIYATLVSSLFVNVGINIIFFRRIKNLVKASQKNGSTLDSPV